MSEIQIKNNTKEEVAYKLMNRILGQGSSSTPSEEECLTLYAKCLRVVHGESPKTVLSSD